MCTVARKQIDITKHGDRREVFITKRSLVTIIGKESNAKTKVKKGPNWLKNNVEHVHFGESRKCELLDFTLSDMYLEWVLMLPG